MIQSECAKPAVLEAFRGLWLGPAILRFEIRLFGYQVQPSGLQPHPAFSGSELSHSLVNTTQWLTGRAFLGAERGPTCAQSVTDCAGETSLTIKADWRPLADCRTAEASVSASACVDAAPTRTHQSSRSDARGMMCATP